MKSNTTLEYTAPEMEVILTAVESGFQASFGDAGQAGQDFGFNDYDQEF